MTDITSLRDATTAVFEVRCIVVAFNASTGFSKLSVEQRDNQSLLQREVSEHYDLAAKRVELAEQKARKALQREHRREKCKVLRAADRAAAHVASLACQARARRQATRTSKVHAAKDPSNSEWEFLNKARRKGTARPRTNRLTSRRGRNGRDHKQLVIGRRVYGGYESNTCVRKRGSCTRRTPPLSPPRVQGSPSAHHVGPCGACGRLSSNRCGGCRSVAYCGPDCQQAHWRVHKITCRSDGATPTQSSSCLSASTLCARLPLAPCPLLPLS